jgi:hypothetical protein
MEGEIEIKSKVGVGSHFICRFQFQLPSLNETLGSAEEIVKENNHYE